MEIKECLFNKPEERSKLGTKNDISDIIIIWVLIIEHSNIVTLFCNMFVNKVICNSDQFI